MWGVAQVALGLHTGSPIFHLDWQVYWLSDTFKSLLKSNNVLHGLCLIFFKIYNYVLGDAVVFWLACSNVIQVTIVS